MLAHSSMNTARFDFWKAQILGMLTYVGQATHFQLKRTATLKNSQEVTYVWDK